MSRNKVVVSSKNDTNKASVIPGFDIPSFMSRTFSYPMRTEVADNGTVWIIADNGHKEIPFAQIVYGSSIEEIEKAADNIIDYVEIVDAYERDINKLEKEWALMRFLIRHEVDNHRLLKFNTVQDYDE
jgi:hypothetical protein